MNSSRITVAGFLAAICVLSTYSIAQENQSIWEGRSQEFRPLPRYEPPLSSTSQGATSQFTGPAAPIDESLRHAFEQAYQALNDSRPATPAPLTGKSSLSDGSHHLSNQVLDQGPKLNKPVWVAQRPQAANSSPVNVDLDSNEFSPKRVANLGNPRRDETATLPPSYHVDSATPAVSDSRFAFADDESVALWWKQLVMQPLSPKNATEPTDPNALIYLSLKNSPRIQAISKEPIIREMQVFEAKAEFDPVSFLRGQWDDRRDPVGNTLTTGGAPVLEDHIISAVTGLRRKLAAGGDVEIGQTIGFQNSNSRFFVPQDQGTATLALNFTQPLMRGRGRFYNQSQILIAQTTGDVAWEAFKAELQQELERVVRSYWELYYQRSLFLQKKRNVSRGEKILELLEGRRDLDSLPNQITRARSAVLSRKTELADAFNNVRNAETEIRRLIADPNWLQNQNVEMLPVEPAIQTEFDLPLKQVVETALSHRPEIKESLQRAKIAAIQYDVSTNELLPDLSLLFGTYLAALDGGTGIERSFQKQFAGTTPGFNVGFEFEFPLYNRAARSRLAQRSVQQSRIRYEVTEVMQNIIAEAQVAQRRVSTAFKTMNAAEVAIDAAQADLAQNRQRWETFAMVEGDIADGQTPTTVLDQLLDSQDRLTNAELIYSQAELELKLSEVGLRRVMGTLLLYEDVVYTKTIEDGSPAYSIEKGEYPVILDEDSTPVEPEQTPLDDTEMMSPEQLRQLRTPQPQPANPGTPQSYNEPTSKVPHAGTPSLRYPLGDSSNL